MDTKQVKNIFVITAGVIFIILFSILVIRLLFGGDEDTWICENNIWVKHGNPSVSQPISGCGEQLETNTPTPTEQVLIGGDKDEHGCLIAAGYSWCDTKQKCVRVWEEGCDEITTLMAEITKATKIEFSQTEEKYFDWLISPKEKISVKGIKKQVDNIGQENLSVLIKYMTEFLAFKTDLYNSAKTKTENINGFKKANFVCSVISNISDVDSSKFNISLLCGKIY